MEQILKKIYLAGPDVFERNALQIMDHHKRLASSHGFIPLYPLDNVIDLSDPSASLQIYHSNAAMIRDADIVVANVNSFRGLEPDSGTVWEIGYAIGFGKPVIGYMASSRTHAQRVQDAQQCSIEDGIIYDENDQIVENFNLSLNLMLAHSMNAVIIGTLEDALKHAKKLD